MEKIINFIPGYDKRSSKPNENYGINGMEIQFVLKGELGATSVLFYTGWYPEHVQIEDWERNKRYSFPQIWPEGAGIGYHSPTPRYPGQEPTLCCEWLDGKPCYADCSFTASEAVAKAFLKEGGGAVWRALEKWYVDLFGELH